MGCWACGWARHAGVGVLVKVPVGLRCMRVEQWAAVAHEPLSWAAAAKQDYAQAATWAEHR